MQKYQIKRSTTYYLRHNLKKQAKKQICSVLQSNNIQSYEKHPVPLLVHNNWCKMLHPWVVCAHSAVFCLMVAWMPSVLVVWLFPEVLIGHLPREITEICTSVYWGFLSWFVWVFERRHTKINVLMNIFPCTKKTLSFVAFTMQVIKKNHNKYAKIE